MSEDRYATEAARALRAARANVGPHAAVEPEQAIAALAVAIRGSARRRRARIWIAGGAVAIASGAAAAILVLHARPPAAGRVAGSVAAAPSGARVAFRVAGPTPTAFAAGDTLASGAGATALTAADGTSLELAPRSQVKLVRGDAVRWFQLQSGSIEAHVAKLAAGQRFVVATPDRQVEVRGTRFRVSLVPADGACGNGTVTRVSVDEGVVTVRAPEAGAAEVRVAAGERWPADCAPATAAPREAVARIRATERPRKLRPPIEPEPVASSTLGAENDLFGQAIHAERAGDFPSALQVLDQLITRYPGSPLREPAEAERARILTRTQPK